LLPSAISDTIFIIVTAQKTASSFVRNTLDCLFLLRIPLLVPVWTILFLGWIIGSDSARPGGFLAGGAAMSSRFWLGTAGFSLIVASIYVVNQIVDIESDRINHKLFLLPQGVISIRTAWIIAGLCALSGLVINAGIIADAPLTVISLLSLLLGALYNLPPAQLKNSPCGGVCASALGHGMLTFLAGWYLAGTLYDAGGSIVLMSGLMSGIAPTLANAAVYLATTIPDAPGDRITGKKTFCVAYGEKKTAVVAFLLCTGAFAASFCMLHHCWVMAFPSAVSLIFFFSFALAAKREHAYSAFKWPVFLLTAFVALFAPEYGIVVLVIFFVSKAYYKLRFNFDYPNLKTK
jgi:4-hydroxybenzoate polyprenyltransferase